MHIPVPMVPLSDKSVVLQLLNLLFRRDLIHLNFFLLYFCLCFFLSVSLSLFVFSFYFLNSDV